MTGLSCPEVLRAEHGIYPAMMEKRVASSGAFSLRRTRYLEEIEQGLLLSAEQYQALSILIKGGDFEAKQKVIAHNLRLVAGIAMHYANRGVEFVDLVSEGVMGLIHALEKFELEGGFRFSSYARGHIRENIERAIMNRTNCRPALAC